MSTNARQAHFSPRSFEQAVSWFVAYAEAEKLWANLDPLKGGELPDLPAARKTGPQKNKR